MKNPYDPYYQDNTIMLIFIYFIKNANYLNTYNILISLIDQEKNNKLLKNSIVCSKIILYFNSHDLNLLI